MDFGQVVLLAASLSFIGLGELPPTPEWGSMISEGAVHFYHWWIAAGPGVAILTIVLGVQFPRRRPARHPRLPDAVSATIDRAVSRLRSSRSAISGRSSRPPRAASRRCAASISTSRRARCSAIVGESGSGKSVTMLAVLGLLPPTARVTGFGALPRPGAARPLAPPDAHAPRASASA